MAHTELWGDDWQLNLQINFVELAEFDDDILPL